MTTDAPDWERVVVIISGGGVSDAPDWERTVTGPGGAAVGGYASLTGAGQTSSPGDLTQVGGFTVADVEGDGITLLSEQAGSVSLTTTGSGGITLDCEGGEVLIAGDTGIAISSDAVGFFGTTPQPKPTVTGSRGGNAALASLLTSLEGLGLLVDGTTS